MARAFTSTRETYGGQVRRVYRLSCSACGSKEPPVIGNSFSGSLPPEMLNKTFRQKGWVLGKREGQDVCPTCSALLKQETTVKPTAPPLSVVKAAPAPAPQRDLGIDDALIISSRLDDVFDPKRGYSDNMTDATLAAELNCPRAWVATIRQKKFGGAFGSNEAIEAYLRDALELARQAETAKAEAARVLPLVHGLEQMLERVQRGLDDLNRRRADIEKTIR